MQIQLLRADTTSLKVDALVYPAAEGSDEPVVVSSGNFLCRFVIHVPVPKAGEGDDELKLRKATTAALDFRTRARSLQRAVFCLFGQAELDAFQAALEELEG